MNKNEIVIFETEDKMITLPVAAVRVLMNDSTQSRRSIEKACCRGK